MYCLYIYELYCFSIIMTDIWHCHCIELINCPVLWFLDDGTSSLAP